MADEQHRRVQLALELGHEIENLGLDRRVESRRGLVEDEKRRVLRERHRDHRPLLHAAGELVRVAGHHRVRIRDLHEGKCPACPFARVLARRTEDGVRLGDLSADPHGGVQGGTRVLVDHRDGASAVLAELAPPQGEHVTSCDRDRAG